MNPGSKRLALERYFSGLTEQTFQSRLGVVDPPLVDYLIDLLVRFVKSDLVFRIRDLLGRRLNEVGKMLMEAEERVGDARREVHRHIGDFTLFWAGVYPEALGRMKSPQRLDHLVDYCSQGKRSYRIASTIPSEDRHEENAVLERLSQQFEMCVYGLGEVRREWEQIDTEETGSTPWLLD